MDDLERRRKMAVNYFKNFKRSADKGIVGFLKNK